MKDVKNKACNKSIKGIPIKYKGEIIQLDPKKVGITTFAVTASLVILGTSVYVKAPEIIQSTGNVVTQIGDNLQEMGEKIVEMGQNMEEERQYNDIAVFKYYGQINRQWEDKGYVRYIKEREALEKLADTQSIYNDIVSSNTNLQDPKLYAYFSEYKLQHANMLKILSEKDNKEYASVNDYVVAHGFSDYGEFRNHCDEMIRNELKSQIIKEEKVEDIKNDPAVIQANSDLTTFWVSEVQMAEDADKKLFEFYSIYKDMDLVDELVMKYGFSQGIDYNDLEQYLIQKGYTSVEEWKNYYMEQTESQGRGM